MISSSGPKLLDELPEISESVFHLAPLGQAIILFPFSLTQTWSQPKGPSCFLV